MLTPRNLQLLTAIAALSDQYNAYPSLADIAKRMNLNSRSTVKFHLHKLRDANFVVLVSRGGESGWRLTTTACEYLKREQPYIASSPSRYVRNRLGLYRKHRKRQRLTARVQAWSHLDAYSHTGLELVE